MRAVFNLETVVMFMVATIVDSGTGLPMFLVYLL